MLKGYHIREYRQTDQEKIINLYARTFGKDAALKFENRWPWEFRDNPANKNFSSNNWVAEYNNEIVAHLGALGALLKVNKKIINCLWAVDLMTDKNHRDKGLAKELYEKFENMQVDINLMIGLSIPTRKIALKRNWQEFRIDTTSIKVLNLKGLLRFIFSREKFNLSFSWVSLVIGIILGLLINSLKLFPGKKPLNKTKMDVISLSNFDERFDRLWQGLLKEHKIIFVKNKEFLNWRYIENPNYKYKILAAKEENTILGYIVLSIDKKDNFKLGTIIDFIALSNYPSANKKLSEEAIKYFKQESVDLILSTGLGKQQKKVFSENGFIDNLLVREHLRPRFFLKIDKDELKKEVLKNPDDWFISNTYYDLFM